MTAKKVVAKAIVKEKTETPEVTLSGKCPVCVNGRIPQKVDFHYVSCEVCQGTALA